MKVKFKKSGGFAGIQMNVELDSDKMDQEKSQTLFNLIKALPFDNKEPQTCLDGFDYDLSIEDANETKKMHLNDSQLTDELSNLFDFLLDQ